MKSTKVVLDGTLFAECEMQGANRDGMMRLTEDITNHLVLDDSLDISFASTVYIRKYDTALKNFVAKNYPNHTGKIFSKNPPSFTNVLKWKSIFRAQLSKLPISPYYRDIDKQQLFHSFYYPFPRTIFKNKIKKSITYLDIIPLILNGYPNSLVNRTKDIVNDIAGNFAISISEHSKQDLLNYDKRIDPQHVFVAPLAASPSLFYQNNNAHDWERVKKKYNLPERYFLCVSGADTRKNIPHVVKSFNKFVLQEKKKDVYLVLTGNQAHSQSMLDKLNISQPVRDKIFMPSVFIDSKDLSVLYSNALCFLFMSLYEGFGLPALEAMQCGAPTVASNTTSLPEVVGDGGILISPTDEDALAGTMKLFYDNEAIRKNYAALGLQRAASFSWERCAADYAKIFEKITSNFSQ